MNHRLYWLLVLILACAMNPPRATACNIPVFRYALERWRADRDDDRYRIIVFHRGPLTAEYNSILDTLSPSDEQPTARANLIVETIDLSGSMEPSKRELWQRQRDAKLPWMVVRTPDGEEKKRTIWAGSLDNDAARKLMDSPARRHIARRLMKGHSIVWVLLECGDKERDDTAAAILQTQLRRLENKLQLPNPAGDDSVELLSSLPLRLAFSTVRVKRTDAMETMLIEMLLHTDSDLAKSREPMVFPIFGRGRALDALVGKGINAETIEEAAKFLCGACSCLVKRLNPGVDLLIAADWDAVIEDRDTRQPPPKGERVPIPTPKQRTVIATNEAISPPARMFWPVAIGGAMLLVGLCALTLRLRVKQEEGPT